MALKARNQTKLITASGGGTLVADADESFLIKDIFCVPSSNDTYLALLTQGTGVGAFRVKGKAGNHLPYPIPVAVVIYEWSPGTILSRLRRLGKEMLGLPGSPADGGLEDFQKNPLDIRFPIASGETFRVTRYAEAGNVCLLYDIYDAGDIKPEMPNGSKSRISRYLHYATNVASAASGAVAVSTTLMGSGSGLSGWAGGDEWPVNGLAVAEKNVYRLLAIAAAPLAKGNAAGSANAGYTTHLQLIARNTILMDEDRVGLPMLGNSAETGASTVSYVSKGSVVGPGTQQNPPGPYLFDPRLEFGEGEKLTTNIVIAGYASGGPGAGELDLAFVLEHEYLAG